MQQYLVSFFLFLIYGAIIINGFFNVTRGGYKIMPDGSKMKEGQLLRDWYLFWFKEKVQKDAWLYSGDELLKIVNTWQNTQYRFGIAQIYDDKIIVASLPDLITIKMVADSLNVRVITQPGKEGIEVLFFKDEPAYVFPWYLRKMMAGCVTCHASWLGSVLYWTGYVCLFDATISIIPALLTWPAYCISLAWVLPYLHKKTA